MRCLPKLAGTAALVAVFFFAAFPQNANLTNAQIVEMTKVGLDSAIIIKKIDESSSAFDVSTEALIELRKNGVENAVIARMMEKNTAVTEDKSAPDGFSDNTPSGESEKTATAITPGDALRNAKTVAIEKSSVNPSRQSLEKSLMKRADWQKLNLTLIRYKQEADIYIEIGRVPFSWVTHRYVFRIYDRRTGTIITAGETTSWGSLAENMAKEIMQKLGKVSN